MQAIPTDTPHGRSTRPPVVGKRDMVASAHPLASQAGLAVLRDGGNAFDAAVAVAATLNVVEPYMSGVGGIGVALVYVAAEGRVRALDFSGRAPAAARPERYTYETLRTGILAPMVPGNLRGWLKLHGAYGTRPREELFRDAIDYAAEGFPLTGLNAEVMSENFERICAFPTSAAILYPGGKPGSPGELFRQPQLAESLSAIASEGEAVFYDGQLSERIVAAVEGMGGLITRDDLASYEAEWEAPISTQYRGHTVNAMPPNSSGFQILQTLNIFEGFGSLEHGAPETLHLLMESVKAAIADRRKYSGDPAYADVPVERLLSEAYAAEQRGAISRTAAAAAPSYPGSRDRLDEGHPIVTAKQGSPGSTTHFAVADRFGNVVSITQTLGSGFGSGVAAGDTGIFLNNMSNWFEIDAAAGGPNLIGPGRRVDFCVSPVHVFDADGGFRLSIGTPGSYGILQTTVQMLHGFLDGGLNVQEAIEAPRFRYYEDGGLLMEGRFPTATIACLRERGHDPVIGPAWTRQVGGAHGIERRAGGALLGGADPRRDGVAAGR